MDLSKLKILSLIFPVLACMFMAWYHTQNQNKGELYRIPVTGYDPRDLLRGHYLTYRYDWNWADEDAKTRTHKSAICLDGKANNLQVRLVNQKNVSEQCDRYIIGRGSKTSGFRIGRKGSDDLTRYYIPEENARQLDKMLRNRGDDAHDFEIALRVNGRGQAFIASMYIDDVLLEEWIKENAE